VIMVMFALGCAMSGHLYKPDPNEWLTWFFSFLNAGMGLPYLVCALADWGVRITPEQAAKVTFEYGNTFLCVAGALNMLAAMDAYDIGVGRKSCCILWPWFCSVCMSQWRSARFPSSITLHRGELNPARKFSALSWALDF